MALRTIPAARGRQAAYYDERKRALEHLVYPALGDMPLATLRRSHIVKLLDQIQDRNGDRRADLTLAYLRKIFNWHASRVDDFLSPVVRGMGRYDDKARERSRVLTDDELRKIWAATETPHPYHALIRFLLLTGARRNEARCLPWGEIIGSDWHLPAARNKVGMDFVRPLSRAAIGILECRRGRSRRRGAIADIIISKSVAASRREAACRHLEAI